MRLIVRPDFDGLVCSLYLKKIFRISAVAYSEPKDIQDGNFKVQPQDIIANLPYHPNCAWWFDHHASNEIPEAFRGIYEVAPSAAGLIWNGFKDQYPTLGTFEFLTKMTDLIDGGIYSLEDILNPQGYYLISYTVIPSPDLKDADYWDLLTDLLELNDPGQILQDSEVNRRVQHFLAGQELFKSIVLANSRIKNGILVSDFRTVALPDGSFNRFLPYALFPESKLSISLTALPEKPGMIKISLAKSVLNRTSDLHVGFLLRKFGGGGHAGAGSIRVPENQSDKVIGELLTEISR